ncbi:3,4-dihydroxy-2-butanone-4-phosphate synthase [Nocardia sp. NPDC003963]
MSTPYLGPDDFDSVSDALAALAGGEFAVIVDDESQAGEGYLAISAEHVSTEQMSFLVRHTSGYACVAMTEDRAIALDIPLMVAERHGDHHRVTFGVSVDVARGTTTGISAADRATTARALADPATAPKDLSRPGHVVPLLARPGGVLERRGHAEAGVDLCLLTGGTGVVVLSVLVDDRGDPASNRSLFWFARQHGMPIVTIDAIVTHRSTTEPLVRRLSSARIPTGVGAFVAHAYGALDGTEHIAFVADRPYGPGPTPLVRIHSECLTGDVFGSLRCDCGPQLDESLRSVAASGDGAVVYLRGHEGRGIGLAAKLAAYALQEHGYDTVEANAALGLPIDSRDYAVAASVLRDLGLTSIRLLTNNPAKAAALELHGITIVEVVRTSAHLTPHNVGYLHTKNEKLGQRIPLAPTA